MKMMRSVLLWVMMGVFAAVAAVIAGAVVIWLRSNIETAVWLAFGGWVLYFGRKKYAEGIKPKVKIIPSGTDYAAGDG